MTDTVGRPGARFGDDQRPIGRKQSVDREQSERRRTVDDDEFVVDSLQRKRKPIVGADRVGEQLWFAHRKGGCGCHHRRGPNPLRVIGPCTRRPESGNGASALFGECLVDGERRIPYAEAGRGVPLRVEIDDQGVDASRPSGGGETERNRGLPDAAFLVHHRNHNHGGNGSGRSASACRYAQNRAEMNGDLPRHPPFTAIDASREAGSGGL